MKYKYVYVRGRVDCEENEWHLYANTDKKSAVSKFRKWVKKEYDVEASTDTYIEIVVASNSKFDVTDGCEF